MEKIEERISNILDQLTSEVKIEDAAILVGGFYAGMNGYTPISALMKLTVFDNDTNVYEAALRSMFGIPGLAIQGIFDILTREEKEQSVSDKYIPMDRMDPRKITTDYLYERMMFLKDASANAQINIDAAQELIDAANGQLIINQDYLNRYTQQLAAGHPRQNDLVGYQQQIDAYNIWIQRLIAEIERLKALEYTEEIAELIATYAQALSDAQADLAHWQQEFQILKNQIESWKADLENKISMYQNMILGLQNEIASKQEIIKRNQQALADLSEDLPKINRILLEKKLALGMVGMIEAYAITRPDMVGKFGEILKGVGEIVPL